MTGRPAAGSRSALIIANSAYDDAGLSSLVAPAGDAAALARALANPETCGFAVDTVVEGSSVDVRRAVDDFLADRERADLVLLYFSCHGVKDEQGRLYFAARDTRRNRLASTATPAAFVNDLLLACRSRRKVLILDCCYSGAFAAGLRVKADPQVHTAAQFDARGLVVLTATDAAQYAFEGDAVTGTAVRSAFTAALVAGMDTGEADVDGDGLVSVDDVHEYVRRQLAEHAYRQSPRKWEFDVQGRIVLARSPRSDAPAAPVVLPPPQQRPPAETGATPAVRRPHWWLGAALVAAGAALVAALLNWWLLNLMYWAFPYDYLSPDTAAGVGVAAAAGAGWGMAYAVADAVDLAARPASSRWYEPYRRWGRILGAVVVPSRPGRFVGALTVAVPLNVAVAMAMSQAIGAIGYALSGSDARERAFNLAFTLLNVVPIAAYLRSSFLARRRGPDG
ncbi:caspase family protein [Micromonospora sp. NPDC126480]|uniref:caspase family protein n=1 Tax=Micromonospora sp. NPDC126480 TaxID=3155312 RepID=UPI00331A54BA